MRDPKWDWLEEPFSTFGTSYFLLHSPAEWVMVFIKTWTWMKNYSNLPLLSLGNKLSQFWEGRSSWSPYKDPAKIDASGKTVPCPFYLPSFITLLEATSCCPLLTSRSPTSLGESKPEGPGVLWHSKPEEKLLQGEWGDMKSIYSSAAY